MPPVPSFCNQPFSRGELGHRIPPVSAGGWLRATPHLCVPPLSAVRLEPASQDPHMPADMRRAASNATGPVLLQPAVLPRRARPPCPACFCGRMAASDPSCLCSNPAGRTDGASLSRPSHARGHAARHIECHRSRPSATSRSPTASTDTLPRVFMRKDGCERPLISVFQPCRPYRWSQPVETLTCPRTCGEPHRMPPVSSLCDQPFSRDELSHRAPPVSALFQREKGGQGPAEERDAHCSVKERAFSAARTPPRLRAKSSCTFLSVEIRSIPTC
jgi:hypothetical protein